MAPLDCARATNGATALVRPLHGIVIDGDLSDWPDTMERHPVALVGYGGRPSGTADLESSFRIGHDRCGALYIALEVGDDSVVMDPSASLWNSSDGCSIYLCADHGESQAAVAQYAIHNGRLVLGKAESAEWAAARGAGFHRYEWRIGIPAVVSQEAPLPRTLGFDVSVVDRDVDGTLSWVAWGGGLRKYEDPNRLGDAVLLCLDVPSGSLQGSLRWEHTGEPADGQKLHLSAVGHPAPKVTVVTDAAGAFAVRLPAGKYAIRRPLGQARARADTAEVIPAEPTQIDLELSPPLPEVRVAGTGTRLGRAEGVQSGPWRYLGVADGLADQVNALSQGHTGDIWIGLEDEVVRYDGRDLYSLTTEDGLPGGRVTAVQEDGDGGLWIGTDSGLAHYDGAQIEVYSEAQGLPSRQIHLLFRDREGGLWIGTALGLVLYDGRRFRTFTTSDGLPNESVRALLEDRDGGLWIGTESGIARYDGTSFSPLQAGGDDPRLTRVAHALAQDAQGRLWFGVESEVGCYDGAAVTFYTQSDGVPGRGGFNVPRGALVTDASGTLWVGTSEGLARFDGHSFQPVLLHDGTPATDSYVLLVDRDDNLWYRSQYGLVRFETRAFMTPGAPEGLPRAAVAALVEDHVGTLWVGTERGLYRLDGQRFRETPAAGAPEGARVTALCEDSQSRLWLGWRTDHRSGLGRVEDGRWTVIPAYSTATPSTIGRLLETGDGALWIATEHGLHRLRGERVSSLLIEDGLPDNHIHDLLERPDGSLLIATRRGLARYADGELTREKDLERTPATALARAADGAVWVASDAGLYSRDGNGLTPVDLGSSSPRARINALTVDRADQLWMGTNVGVFRYDGQVVQSLLHRDGLNGRQVSDLVQTRDGSVWCATGQGLTRYRGRHCPPDIRSVETIADRRYADNGRVELPLPQKLVAFEFPAYGFKTRAGATVYRYRLAGREASWQTTHHPRVEYRDLPRGEYRFEVEAVDRDLDYSPRRSVELQIHLPYRQMGLYTILGLSLLAVAVSGGRLIAGNRRLVQARRRLAEMNRELELRVEERTRESEAKSEFLSNMSHELRTPLNSIIGMIDLTLESELPPQERSYLDTAQDSADMLLHLIGDILDFSKIEAGKMTLEHVPFSLRESLSGVVKGLAAKAHAKGLEMHFGIDPEVPDHLVGDAGRLRQALVNLLGNAIKFTDTGEVVLGIESTETEDERVYLHAWVRDTGVGIADAKQAQIFDEFTQADESTTRRFGGTGLGLAITRRLAELMDGRLWLESEEGAGSTFHLQVCLDLGESPLMEDLGELLAFAGRRVLLADGQETSRQLVETQLRAWDVRVTAAPDLSSALAALTGEEAEAQAFALFLLDADLIDGAAQLELDRLTAAMEHVQALVLLVKTGQQIVAGTAAVDGAVRLLKPVSPDELRVALRAVLKGELPRPDSPVPDGAEGPSGEGWRVLLAEDTVANQKLVTSLLRKHGHDVVVADNGREALDELMRGPFDLVLMDVHMPVMDGLTATSAIRAREEREGGHVPIIAMTASATQEDEQRSLQAGMDAYVAKPIRIHRVMEVLDRVVASRQPPEFGQNRPIDAQLRERFLEQCDGDEELLDEMVDVVLQSYPPLWDEVREAVSSADASRVEQAAHALKGVVGVFGQSAVHEAAYALEQAGRENRLEAAEGAQARLADELGTFVRSLQGLKTDGSA